MFSPSTPGKAVHAKHSRGRRRGSACGRQGATKAVKAGRRAAGPGRGGLR